MSDRISDVSRIWSRLSRVWKWRFCVQHTEADPLTVIHESRTDDVRHRCVFVWVFHFCSLHTHTHTCRDTWETRPPHSLACMHTFVHSNANTHLTRKSSSPILPLWKSRPHTWHAMIREDLRTDGDITAETANHVPTWAGFYSTHKHKISERDLKSSRWPNETRRFYLYSVIHSFT